MANPLTPTGTYGSDSYALTDLQYVSQQVTDPVQLICLRIARRLQTPRGALALINGDPNFGLDTRQFVLGKQTPGFLQQAQQRIQAECEKDEQVLSCTVSVVPGDDGNSLVITINIEAAQGPFPLTLNVNALTVDLLMPSQGAI